MTAHETGPRIAILGGGIGGLGAAAFLYREGLAGTVYEQVSRLGEVGAGLVVAPNAARSVDLLQEPLTMAIDRPTRIFSLLSDAPN
ncbi:NAD(P)-binding protein [Actinacidiphila glaucinigra]|uniref:NAD(P)-binding protein n=1 Tax=Actinacidiphila glaucinigra TaxID=235986 RepID=UPI0030849D50|nr:NAD(P)-binding protein [Actinacidiphila glaucinigra]